VLDAAVLIVSCLLAYTIRFEGLDWVASAYRTQALLFLALTVPLRLAIFHGLGVYRRYWTLASVAELENILTAEVAATIASATVGIAIVPLLGVVAGRVPLSVLALDGLMVAGATALPRFMARLVGWRAERARVPVNAPRALIIGAGQAGQMAARELWSQPQLGLLPVGFLDDDRMKQHLLITELPVLGTIDDLPRVVKALGVNEVIIAMPTAPGPLIRRVVQLAREAGVGTRTVPGLFEILSGRKSVTAIREVQIEDLLRRAPIETNLEAVRALTTERVVLVTGAGGSIGSELCRQLAQLGPSELVLLGRGENSIFEIHQELSSRFSGLKLTPVIADVRDRPRIDDIVRRHAPRAIFHAAAHKHVPLMEANVIEALTNNVLGTHNIVSAAIAHDVSHFVLISTDKAVRPKSVMGASKRIAEQLVQLAAARCEKPYVSVRFGNVLGSRGSVVPTFLQQIRSGGPLTITHPEMRRYFMTIPEAVQLVLQAFALGRRGEVFCLDMGEAVRISDLARDLITLSGLQVGQDIEINYTGVRAGEKLFEEMFFSAEQVLPTEHPKVLRARHAGLASQVEHRIDELLFATKAGAPEADLRRLLLALVPDFAGADTTVAASATPSANGGHAPRAHAPKSRRSGPPAHAESAGNGSSAHGNGQTATHTNGSGTLPTDLDGLGPSQVAL
jgi:FlaA1/EpsC-like NDP-sugar epimerase